MINSGRQMISPVRGVTTLPASNLHLNSFRKGKETWTSHFFRGQLMPLQQTPYSVHAFLEESDFQFLLNSFQISQYLFKNMS